MSCPFFLIVTLAWNWLTQQNCYMNSYIACGFELLVLNRTLTPMNIYCSRFTPDKMSLNKQTSASSIRNKFKILNAINVNHLMGKILNYEYFFIKVGWRLKVIYTFWQKSKSVTCSSWWFCFQRPIKNLYIMFNIWGGIRFGFLQCDNVTLILFQLRLRIQCWNVKTKYLFVFCHVFSSPFWRDLTTIIHII